MLCCGVAGIAGFFLCEMMVRKKFRVFTGKRIAESGVFLGVMVLCLVCMEKDVFGIERKVPKEKEIAGIYLDGSYRCYLTEASEIRQCLALHRSLIDAKEEYETYFKEYSQRENCPYMTCNLTYELKNGTVMKRSYFLPLEDYYVEEAGGPVEMLFALEKDPKKYLEYYFSSAYGSMVLGNGCSYNHFRRSGAYQNEALTIEEAEQLCTALKEDMQSEDYRIYPYGLKKWETEIYVDTVDLTYTIPDGSRVFQMEEEKFSTGKYPEYVNIPLTTSCRRTIALLQKMGYLEEEPVTEREYEKITEEYELQ